MVKIPHIAAGLVLLCTCARARSPVPFTPEVQVWGSLREIMHEGKTGSTVSLAGVPRMHSYGVGALSGLRGEILLLDGIAFISTVQPGGVAVKPTANEQATLLVAAAVPSWKSVPIRAAIAADELDERLEILARAGGMDVELAFPLLIDGQLDVDWHVLDGAKGAPGGSHADHLRDAVTGQLVGAQATVVGFFSKYHAGVFTHMGQRTHFHVLTADRKVMGHVDRLAVRAGATLRLPARVD
jgi:acetolactate decarboxylase